MNDELLYWYIETNNILRDYVLNIENGQLAHLCEVNMEYMWKIGSIWPNKQRKPNVDKLCGMCYPSWKKKEKWFECWVSSNLL